MSDTTCRKLGINQKGYMTFLHDSALPICFTWSRDVDLDKELNLIIRLTQKKPLY